MTTAETYFARERLETLMVHVALATVARDGLRAWPGRRRSSCTSGAWKR